MDRRRISLAALHTHTHTHTYTFTGQGGGSINYALTSKEWRWAEI